MLIPNSIIYLIGVVDNLKLFSLIYLMGVVFILIYLIILDEFKTVVELFGKNIEKLLCTTLLIAVLTITVVPDSKTLKFMAINTFITYDNLNTVGNITVEAVDYIFDKVDNLINDR